MTGYKLPTEQPLSQLSHNHYLASSATSKKSPYVYKSCPLNEFSQKMNDFTTFTKIALNMGNLGKIIVASGFKKLPKVQ